MRKNVFSLAVVGICLLVGALWKGRAQPAQVPDFSGEWRVVSATGAAPPDGFVMHVQQSSMALRITEQHQDAQTGLTLLGLTSPEVSLSTDGREDLNQAGPFVLHVRSQWSGARLITNWTTSEYLGVSFQGQWVRFLSADGREMTIEIHANSSKGQHSDAVLKFQRG
jgi:hypothetical protein